MSLFLACVLMFFISLVLTWSIRYYSLCKNILDIPNERSSHVVPVPRSGGLAIVVTFLIGVIFLYSGGLLATNIAIALTGGGILIAVVGAVDDVKSVSVRWRMLLQFTAAIWAVYFLGGFPTLSIGQFTVEMGWLGAALAVIGIVWMINLYNFMDGIDGLAGGEAVFVSFVAGVLLWMHGIEDISRLCFLLGAAAAGFLVWNWSPAKIFLGDAGSYFLGFTFAVLAITTQNYQNISIIVWCILMAVFICDATFTLLHRMIRRECLYVAHRDHLYQRLVKKGAAHSQVTLGILLFNLFILVPFAFFMMTPTLP